MAVRAVPCTLNGREWNLRLDLGGIADLEDQGVELEAMLAKLREGKFSGVRLMLWAMLRGQDGAPTLQDVGRWVDGENLMMVVEHVREALRLAFPHQETTIPPLVGAGIGEPPSALPTAPST